MNRYGFDNRCGCLVLTKSILKRRINPWHILHFGSNIDYDEGLGIYLFSNLSFRTVSRRIESFESILDHCILFSPTFGI